MTSAKGRPVGTLVLLLTGLVAACTGGGQASPSGSAGGSSGAVPSPVASFHWAECPLPTGPGAVVRAVTAGGTGAPWTAVGQEGGGAAEVRPAVWTSPDGCRWQRAAVRPVTPDGERTGFAAVARRGRLVVALGRSFSKVHGNARPTLWRATGTAPLREVELPRELFGGTSGISAIALGSGPAAVLALGAYLTPGNDVAVQTWRTTDGTDWSRLPPGPGQVSTGTEQLLPRGMATGPAGTLLVGTALELADGVRDGFDGAAWFAAGDARQWRRADLAGTGLVGRGDQRLLTAARLGSGYAAVAAVQSGSSFGLRSAVSADGLSWSAGAALPLDRELPGGGLPAATVATGPAGGTADASGGVVAGTVVAGRAELWRSADGRTWRPETVPASAGTAATDVVLGGGGPDPLVLVVQTSAGPRGYVGR